MTADIMIKFTMLFKFVLDSPKSTSMISQAPLVGDSNRVCMYGATTRLRRAGGRAYQEWLLVLGVTAEL